MRCAWVADTRSKESGVQAWLEWIYFRWKMCPLGLGLGVGVRLDYASINSAGFSLVCWLLLKKFFRWKLCPLGLAVHSGPNQGGRWYFSILQCWLIYKMLFQPRNIIYSIFLHTYANFTVTLSIIIKFRGFQRFF